MRLNTLLMASAALCAPLFCGAAQADDGLLFHLSADRSLSADIAGGQAEPTFADKVAIVSEGGRSGGYLQAQDDQVLAWAAPGNIQAQRGTLSFFWRSRYPVGQNPFPLFRVSYANHSSWDMTFLRIDWNGHGFDAFVTDANLARVRVSWAMPQTPAPDQWTHIAFTWDETAGVKLYVDGRLVARKDQPALLDAGLDQFGPHSRIISPIQVQSRYNFLRGGDLDEIRIYDHALDDAAASALAENREPTPATAAIDWRPTWNRRHGFDGAPPPYLTDANTRIRRVEFTDQRDVAQRMWKGNDGIRETTWPGVYNRSRLEGRHDYFTLPDWNVYSMGGKAGTWFLPDEPWNQIELQGAAYGRLSTLADGAVPEGSAQVTDEGELLTRRRRGVERTTTRLSAERTGGAVRFVNEAQETPIEEIGAYRVSPGAAPTGIGRFDFTLRADADPNYPTVKDATDFIAGRYPAEEQTVVAALPAGAPTLPRTPRSGQTRPIVHVVIPQDFRTQAPGLPLSRGGPVFGYENFGGLDGIQLALPALDIAPTRDGLIPLNIRIKEPLTPTRDLMDVNVSVKPGEARTLWLDTRDRILPSGKGIYFTIASADPAFGADSLDGTRVALVFKSREEARVEHEHDRFEQVRDNYGFLVEERQNTRELGLFNRFYEDLMDLLRVNPEHAGGVRYWAEWNPQQPLPPIALEPAPEGVPAWAWGQTQALKQAADFVNWWIDNRQVEGEFGGGLSDDTDLTNQWPGLALMGIEPDKLNASLSAMIDAIYRNGMFTRGLGTIVTDELHVYEEGGNAISQAAYMNPGDPLTLERLMETAIRYQDLTAVNPQGNRLLVSNYFGGDHIVTETPWQWSKPYSYMIFHPGILLVDWNGSPELKRLLLELADGYLAHGRQDAQGLWTYPTEINWPDGATRGGSSPQQTNLLMWAAWRWTGDERYLRPIEQTLRSGGAGALAGIITSDIPSALSRPELAQAWIAAARAPNAAPLALHGAWAATGDKTYLERLYDDLRKDAQFRMPMMTEDHWWVDRVEIPTMELQRQRLGGVALWRNAIVPGHLIGWRFDQDRDAEKLAVLVREPSPTGLRILAHNLSDAPISAVVTGAGVATGRWTMTQSVDVDADDRADAAASPHAFDFGRDQALNLTFAPGVTTVIDLKLDGPEIDIWARPDLAVDAHSMRWRGEVLEVTVHSLGSIGAPEAQLQLVGVNDEILAQTGIAALEAPNDLRPRTTTALLRIAPGTNTAGARVRILSTAEEISKANNEIIAPRCPL